MVYQISYTERNLENPLDLRAVPETREDLQSIRTDLSIL